MCGQSNHYNSRQIPVCLITQQLLLSRVDYFPHEKRSAGFFVRNQDKEGLVEFDGNRRTENFGKEYGCGSCSLSSSLINLQQGLVNCLQRKGANTDFCIWGSKREVKINSLFMEYLGEERIDKIQWNKLYCVVNLQQPATRVFSMSGLKRKNQN